jgi:hypothetical protein
MKYYISTIDEIYYNEDIILWCEQLMGPRSQLRWRTQLKWVEPHKFKFYVEFIFENPRHKILFDIAWGHTLTTVDTALLI